MRARFSGSIHRRVARIDLMKDASLRPRLGTIIAVTADQARSRAAYVAQLHPIVDSLHMLVLTQPLTDGG